MTDPMFVITISHQLGSGGAILAQRMAESLGIPFFDREILQRVAKDFRLPESEIEKREERLSTFWESFSRNAVGGDPASILAVNYYEPTDHELFDHECETIRMIAEKSSGVFLGRCGFYTLSDHPHRVSILVHAGERERIERVMELFKVDEEAAIKLIQDNDRARAAYVRTFTHQNWLDASLYDLCMNVSTLGIEKTLEFALACVQIKIGTVAEPRPIYS